ncbi:LCP family protein [uncultured Tessaracoccus sp.]|uniref:LCP family glycopolymer transferase n=1 Tax=uncultured Tessaracoccus sp. TaxID=905023 RepID=UPI0025EA0C50|nr:LCP family protein [uncultured Tessaracoccus sp.]
MDEPGAARPRRGFTDDAGQPGSYRDTRPRRMITDDSAGARVAPRRTRETVWRAAAPQPPSLADDLFRPDPAADEPTVRRDRPPAHAAPPAATPDPTKRDRRQRFRFTVLFTFLSALVPGLGLLGSRSRSVRAAGATVSLGFVGLVAATVALFASRVHVDEGESFLHAAASAVVGLAAGRGVLHVTTVLLIALGVLWVALIAGTHLATRPRGLGNRRRFLGALLVAVLSAGVAGPVAVGANYSQVLASSLGTTFGNDSKVVSDSKPTIEGPNPFGGMERLNILLIGSDLDSNRKDRYEKQGYGLRTDSVILASIDTTTGQAVLVQIPRNLQHTPFPEGSPMAEEFPDGFRGEGDEADWYFNAIWRRTLDDYADLYAGQTYPGAEALKDGVEGITGLPVHYFLMLNIDGLRNLIDAMGGVTVNVNERLPMGGSSENRDATFGWIEVGPDQHLDGLHALWYARSRWSSDDYSRMERQSCLIKAVTDQANPGTLLTRFEAIAGASSDMVTTDIPQEALESLTDLALKTQQLPMQRLVFAQGRNGYSFSDPDFEAMRARVDEMINPPSPAPTPSATTSAASTPSASPSDPDEGDDGGEDQPGTPKEGAQDVGDACAFNPKE